MRSKKLTTGWLKKHGACEEAVDAFKAQTETDVVKLLKRCMKADRFDWANWLIVRKMTYKQYVSYAIFAAEQGVGLYEKKYPSDKRPRHAIEAARRCIKNSTQNNRDAADSAAYKTMKKKILNHGIKLLEGG